LLRQQIDRLATGQAAMTEFWPHLRMSAMVPSAGLEP